MRKITFVSACLGIGLGLAGATPAHAQNQHSFVSGTGGGFACTFTAPCGDINTALASTASEGMITCMDQGANSGSFSVISFIVARSVAIDCAGTSAAISSIAINTAGIVVTLRHLTIEGAGAANDAEAAAPAAGPAAGVEGAHFALAVARDRRSIDCGVGRASIWPIL